MPQDILLSKARIAIQRKLRSKKLSPSEITDIISYIVTPNSDDSLIAFFIATGFNPGFDQNEILALTQSIANSGDKFVIDGKVLDKHSIGGVGGKAITPLVVPIIANFPNVIVPNTSTKAITSASATADMLETFVNIEYTIKELYRMLEKSNAFMIWGGSVNLAPADERIITVQKKSGIESIDKVVSSIMAKKIAQGVNHLLIDIPMGIGAKISKEEDFDICESNFIRLAKYFGIRIDIHKRYVNSIDGNAVGPKLEARELFRIYEGHDQASESLLGEALVMSAKLAKLAGVVDDFDAGLALCKDIFLSGKAESKFREIIALQGGDANLTADRILPSKIQRDFKSSSSAQICSINNLVLFEFCKILGNPTDTGAGVYFNFKPGQNVMVGDVLFTAFSSSVEKMNQAFEFYKSHSFVEMQ